MTTPTISVIIVNYNGKKWLKDCLSSLAAQTYKNFEVIFVDNASSDKSVQFVKKNFKKVKIISLEKNIGYAGGNNEGYKHARGRYILLLNNDTLVEKSYLKNMLNAFRKIPKLGIVQSKLILMNKKQLDTCGAFWTSSSFLYYFGNYKKPDLPKYNIPFRVFSCKGASVLIKRELIEQIGLFDEDFWNYYEETDLCHRSWLSGWECWYWPQAICYHAMGGTSLTFSNNIIQFHNFKNKLASIIKNFEFITLLGVIPKFLIINVCISVVWIFTGKWKNSLSLYRAIGWNIKHLPHLLNLRKEVFINKKVADSVYLKLITKNPRLSYYPLLFSGTFQRYED